MMIKVRYEKGVLKPLERVELEEGKEYIIEIKEDIYNYIKRYYGKVKGVYKYRSDELEEIIYGENIC